MLKLDLTGHSSHVSFSRNILSSSSRALRGCEKRKGNEHSAEERSGRRKSERDRKH